MHFYTLAVSALTVALWLLNRPLRSAAAGVVLTVRSTHRAVCILPIVAAVPNELPCSDRDHHRYPTGLPVVTAGSGTSLRPTFRRHAPPAAELLSLVLLLHL